MSTANRRFPLPSAIDELEACFVVKDASGQKLGYVYFEVKPTRLSPAKFLFVLQDGVRRQYREWRSSNECEQTHPSMVSAWVSSMHWPQRLE